VTAHGTTIQANMRVLSNTDILTLLDFPAIIDAVAEAAIIASRAALAARQHLDLSDGTLLIMPALSAQAVGVKLVSVIPGNSDRGLPVTCGTMLLNDGMTGLPLCIMNAGNLTALRTGAVGALSIRSMTPRTLTSLGVVGCGIQGAWQAIFACAVRPIEEIFYCSRSRASELRFVRTVQEHLPGVRLTGCSDSTAVLNRTSIVIAATTSATPVLPDEPELLRGKHFTSVGSFKPTMQELPSAVYRLAGHLVVDSDAARGEVGDVINPLHAGHLHAGDVFHIGDLLSGKRSIDIGQTTAFKSVGLALYDLFVARALHQRAVDRNVGQVIEM
jgi:ornithine cyclodeaminase/alanine dehydrogenase-like protein (mu-crystallin family)